MGRFPGWTTLGLVLAFYVACLTVATYPVVLLFRTHLPSLCDPLDHLWVMRWYKDCLVEGRAPGFCPELEYPVGVSLGHFSALHLESILYLMACLVCDQDAGRYNLVWAAGLLTTGLGTFVLVWYILRSRVCAGFGGLLAMLSTPMLSHATGHIELLFAGGVSLFLVAWLRFVDQPSRGRLAAVVALYALVAMSVSYYMVMSTVPTALYVAWRLGRKGGGGRVAWARDRAGWLLGFAALTVLCLALLLLPQIRLMIAGSPTSRNWAEFNFFRVPLGNYVTPTPRHLLGRLLPVILGAGGTPSPIGIETASYLGVVTMALLAYAAIRRVGFPARRSGGRRSRRWSSSRSGPRRGSGRSGSACPRRGSGGRSGCSG